MGLLLLPHATRKAVLLLPFVALDAALALTPAAAPILAASSLGAERSRAATAQDRTTHRAPISLPAVVSGKLRH